MNAEIIAVGSELLLGQIVNTNARFLSEQLAELGINVYYHTVVGDNANRLSQAIQLAESRADLIVFTGGLGPTKDDLTKETIATSLQKSLVMDTEALDSITAYFHKVGRQMTPNNEKQALILEGSTSLKNEFGMAPGMFLTQDSHHYMLLPGPPFEMEPMFKKYGRESLLRVLAKNEIICSRVLRFFGIGEAQLETEIMDILDRQTNPTIAPLASDGEVTLRITAKHESRVRAISMIDELEKEILDIAGDYFYGYDDTSLIREAITLMTKHSLTLSCAESLTGGLFQSEIASVPGASNVLSGGVVCYSNEVKETVLSVPKEILDSFGAVSEQCARQLAENVRKLCNSQIGISFTGVAGPSEQEDKPVGTVWIGLSIEGHSTQAFPLKLAGGRNGNRVRSVKYGAFYLLKALKELSFN